eukprot:1136630-Pelagomonas_calceolata.AAC.10
MLQALHHQLGGRGMAVFVDAFRSRICTPARVCGWMHFYCRACCYAGLREHVSTNYTGSLHGMLSAMYRQGTIRSRKGLLLTQTLHLCVISIQGETTGSPLMCATLNCCNFAQDLCAKMKSIAFESTILILALWFVSAIFILAQWSSVNHAGPQFGLKSEHALKFRPQILIFEAIVIEEMF